jgi:hypothetical protein
MTKISIASLSLACSLSVAAAVPGARAQGMSPSDPAPVGTTVSSEIHCGSNPVSLEPYDVKVTLLQVVRGRQAWEMLQAADAAARPAGPDSEYILARMRFELRAKIAPGNKSFELGSPMQLVAMSADGREYAAAPVTVPQPALRGPLRAGESREGWAAFLVEKRDRHPLLAFDPASGGATLRGRILWFRLY